MRRAQLAAFPLCVFCLARELTRAATANHKGKPSSGAKSFRPTNSMTTRAGYSSFAISAIARSIRRLKLGTPITSLRTGATMTYSGMVRFNLYASVAMTSGSNWRKSTDIHSSSTFRAGLSTLATLRTKAQRQREGG